jgi:hypothetical protein
MRDSPTTPQPGGANAAELCAVTVVESHGDAVLAKRWHLDGTCTPYGNAYHVTLHPEPVASLVALHALLRRLLPAPRCCIVRAEPVTGQPMRRVRRLLHPCPETGDAPTLREVPRRWVAVDLDGLPAPAGTDPRDLAACAKLARAALPHAFRDAAGIIAATAGHGIKPGARLRWWAWLSRPTTGAELDSWFSCCPVDLATFRPVQPIFTAPPLFDAGVPDPVPERLALVPGAREVVQVPAPALLRPVRVEVRRMAARDAGMAGAGAVAYARRTIAAAPVNARHATAKRMAAFLGHLHREGEVSAGDVAEAVAAGIEMAGKDRAEGEAIARWTLAQFGGAA